MLGTARLISLFPTLHFLDLDLPTEGSRYNEIYNQTLKEAVDAMTGGVNRALSPELRIGRRVAGALDAAVAVPKYLNAPVNALRGYMRENVKPHLPPTMEEYNRRP